MTLENFTDIKINSWKKNILAKKCFFLFADNKNIFTEDEKQRILEEACKILKHHFNILSKEITFAKKINWHTNFSGRSWPKEPYQILNQKDLIFGKKEYIGDVKLPWELSKHLHFQTLAKAYLLTKNEKYAQEFVQEIEDWLKENPYEYGVNWTQGLIVAHRAISWVIALGVFAESPSLHEKLLGEIAFSLYQHALFIEKTYEIGTRSTNHLLGELSAQIILSVIFPEFKHSRERFKFAQRELEKQINLQIYTDGVDYEQSTSYQRYILEFLFLLLILEKRGRLKLSQNFKKRVEKMTEFMMHMTQPNGLLQPISDADGARVFVLGNNINDFRPHLALAAWLFGRGDFKYVSQNHVDQILWFLSNEEWKDFDKIKPYVSPKTSIAFKEGGYWISRQNWSKDSTWLFFDCGLMGLGEWPADLSVGVHGHSDILNFGLALGEETFLTDNGSYSYTTELPFHQYFRSSRAHNLAIVDGQDQNIIESSPWMAKQIARPHNAQNYFSNEFDYLSGQNTGYLRLAQKVLWRREILFEKKRKFIILKDSFLGEGQHQISELFHFAPNLTIIKRKDSFGIKGKKNKLIIKPLFKAPVKIASGETRPPTGWYSPDFGRKEKSSTLEINFSVICPSSNYFWLSWGQANLTSPELIQFFEKKISPIRKKTVVILTEKNVPKLVIKKLLKSLSKNFLIILKENPPKISLKNKISSFLGNQISNLYFHYPSLARLISYFGKAKNILKTKTDSLLSKNLTVHADSITYSEIILATSFKTLLKGIRLKRQTQARLIYLSLSGTKLSFLIKIFPYVDKILKNEQELVSFVRLGNAV